MKLTNLIIGFIVFSLVLSLMFATAGDILEKNSIDGFEDFNQLAGEYEEMSGEMTEKDSTIRDIDEATKIGAAESENIDVRILKGAVSGGRLSTNFITNFENIIHNATGDANIGGQTYIDRRIVNGVIFIIIVIVVLAILHFLRGFKTET